MRLEYQCTKCNTVNSAPAEQERGATYVCHECGGQLKPVPQSESNGDTSMAVGLLGGAAIGAAIGGPPGAIIGGIVGAAAGRKYKGLG